jgi:pimeloyl-ACP methyl ester carboxylesterase
MTPKIANEGEWTLGSFSREEIFSLLEMGVQDWNIASEFFLPYALTKGTPTDTEEFRLALQDMQGNTPHIMIFLWIALTAEDFRPVLKDITVPTLLAYSGDGLICTPAVGEYLAQRIENSKLVIFPGCGHGLFMDDPVKFNSELETFLKE